MHTLTVKWLIQLPSLWLESWNLARLQHWMQCYELQTYSAHITAALGLLTSFSPPPQYLSGPWEQPGAWEPLHLSHCGAGAHEEGMARPLQGLWVLRGLGGRRCRGQPSSRVLGGDLGLEGTSPSCPQAGITLQWGHPGMQLTQAMGLPFCALQEPALMSVLPGGCDPSPGRTPRLPGGIFTCGWMILKRDMHWKPLSSILLMSSNHNLSCLPLVKLFFVFFLWTSHLFFFCPFRVLRLC